MPADGRSTCVRIWPESPAADECWYSEVSEGGEVEVGSPSYPSSTPVEAGMVYLEDTVSGVKFVLTPEDFEQYWGEKGA